MNGSKRVHDISLKHVSFSPLFGTFLLHNQRRQAMFDCNSQSLPLMLATVKHACCGRYGAEFDGFRYNNSFHLAAVYSAQLSF